MDVRGWKGAVVLGALTLWGCSPLDPPQQITSAGLSVDRPIDPPCPEWCRVKGEVRALTDAAGVPLAFEVSLVAQPWEEVLALGRSKWGRPSSIYQMAALQDPTQTSAWMAAAREVHASQAGALVNRLRTGDPRETTDYAVWRSKGTLVRIERDTNGVRATWMREQTGEKSKE